MKILNSDILPAYRWLENKLISEKFPTVETSENAYTDFNDLDNNNKVLSDYCSKYLTDKQKHLLSLSIRAYRLKVKRENSPDLKIKRVALKMPVFERLKEYANSRNLKLSEAVDMLLKK